MGCLSISASRVGIETKCEFSVLNDKLSLSCVVLSELAQCDASLANERIGEVLIVVSDRIACKAMVASGKANVYAARVNPNVYTCVTMSCDRAKVSTGRVGGGLRVQMHHICTSGTSYYLNAVPDVLWLSPDMFSSADFDIVSNVDWVITND